MIDNEFAAKHKDLLNKSTIWKYRGRTFLLPKGEEEKYKEIIKESIKKQSIKNRINLEKGT